MGMVNICELLKSIVMWKEPKKVTGSGQNGKARGQSANFSDCTDNNLAGAVTEPNPIVLNKWNKVNPIVRHTGRPIVREAVGQVGRG